MTELYNLLDNDGDVVGMIQTTLNSLTVEKLWEDYYPSEQRMAADDEGSVIDTFLEIVHQQDESAKQLWIEDIHP